MVHELITIYDCDILDNWGTRRSDRIVTTLKSFDELEKFILEYCRNSGHTFGSKDFLRVNLKNKTLEYEEWVGHFSYDITDYKIVFFEIEQKELSIIT